MTLKELPVILKNLAEGSKEHETACGVIALRSEAAALYETEKYDDALKKSVEALRALREWPDYSNCEFRALLMGLMFDISETHYMLKDYKQSEKEIEMIFKMLDPLLKIDADRFNEYHILAMELSTRILRSRKKTLDLLAKQQINTGVLYEKVNAGVAAATDKLVESMRKGAEMMAQTGDYHGAVKFYMEAIKLAKKRTGRVSRREVRMTIDMARVMMHNRSDLARSKRLLSAVLSHAVALESIDLEQEIISLIEQIDANEAHEPMWRTFLDKLQQSAKLIRKKKSNVAPDATPEATPEAAPDTAPEED